MSQGRYDICVAQHKSSYLYHALYHGTWPIWLWYLIRVTGYVHGGMNIAVWNGASDSIKNVRLINLDLAGFQWTHCFLRLLINISPGAGLHYLSAFSIFRLRRTVTHVKLLHLKRVLNLWFPNCTGVGVVVRSHLTVIEAIVRVTMTGVTQGS